ncbi:MAG: cytochrome c [Phycisphaeraceae bacterium]
MKAKRRILQMAGLVVALGLVGCDEQTDSDVEVSGPSEPLVVVNPEPVVVFDRVLGQQVYQANCAGCHGQDGGGMNGGFPVLKGNQTVVGDPTLLIRMTLHGVGAGPRALPGSGAYGSIMPGISFLSDEEVTAVVSYVRQSWGNQASIVSADDVIAQR